MESLNGVKSDKKDVEDFFVVVLFSNIQLSGCVIMAVVSDFDTRGQ